MAQFSAGNCFRPRCCCGLSLSEVLAPAGPRAQPRGGVLTSASVSGGSGCTGAQGRHGVLWEWPSLCERPAGAAPALLGRGVCPAGAPPHPLLPPVSPSARPARATAGGGERLRAPLTLGLSPLVLGVGCLEVGRRRPRPAAPHPLLLPNPDSRLGGYFVAHLRAAFNLPKIRCAILDVAVCERDVCLKLK